MRVARGVLIIATVFAFTEVTLSLLPRLAGHGLRSLIYVPPQVSREEYDHYLTIRDPITGWPAPGDGVGHRVAPRPSPAYPESSEWCATLYGDSFTFGLEVSDADAWGNILAQRLGCPVGNFGVGGYGTDQALLRFIDNPTDHARVTIVGVFTDNLQRNVNQYRYYLTGGETLSLKPRFVLEDGALKQIPLPVLTYEQFVAGLGDPATAFPWEVFLPGSRHGPVIWSFPYSLSLVRLMRSDAAVNYLAGRPTWIDFYQDAHDSNALRITAAIIEEFRRRAASGKTLLAVLFPSPASYDQFRKTGVSTFASLGGQIEADGIPTLDLTAEFAAYLGTRRFCELWTEPDTCSGHYNVEGSRVVAEAVQGFMAANRVVLPVDEGGASGGFRAAAAGL